MTVQAPPAVPGWVLLVVMQGRLFFRDIADGGLGEILSLVFHSSWTWILLGMTAGIDLDLTLQIHSLSKAV